MASDWKARANERRDARHTKDSDEHKATSHNKRNTKKWCRGKVGVEHKLECKKYNEVKRTGYNFHKSWRLLVCTACGKEIDTYYGTKKKPDWLPE